MACIHRVRYDDSHSCKRTDLWCFEKADEPALLAQHRKLARVSINDCLANLHSRIAEWGEFDEKFNKDSWEFCWYERPALDIGWAIVITQTYSRTDDDGLGCATPAKRSGWLFSSASFSSYSCLPRLLWFHWMVPRGWDFKTTHQIIVHSRFRFFIIFIFLNLPTLVCSLQQKSLQKHKECRHRWTWIRRSCRPCLSSCPPQRLQVHCFD